jgi:hypothetical protein
MNIDNMWVSIFLLIYIGGKKLLISTLIIFEYVRKVQIN